MIRRRRAVKTVITIDIHPTDVYTVDDADVEKQAWHDDATFNTESKVELEKRKREEKNKSRTQTR